MITKMADKMAAACQFAFVDTLSYIFYPISSKFNIWITFIKFSHVFEWGYVQWTINEMAAEMTAAFMFALVDTLT